MRRVLLRVVPLTVLVWLVGCASLTETGQRYRSVVRNVEGGRISFAVMHLEAIVRDAPDSPYAAAAMFALGEHYFDNGDSFNALKMLSDYVHRTPEHKAAIFAKLLVYKLILTYEAASSASVEAAALIKEIRKELFSEPIFFIFYDKKSPRSYRSLFRNTYLVYDYVDRIKVFRNDKLFLELSP